MGKLVQQEAGGLTHFTHEGVEALPMLIAVKQQLPHVTLQHHHLTSSLHARRATHTGP